VAGRHCDVTTVDFESLYPALIADLELCYSTLIRRKDLLQMKTDGIRIEYTKTPEGVSIPFAQDNINVLPLIMHEGLDLRAKIRKVLNLVLLQ
jgi:DNA polymerase elongation subunit (family B)